MFAFTTVSFVISVVPSNHPSNSYPAFEGAVGMFASPIFSPFTTSTDLTSVVPSMNLTVYLVSGISVNLALAVISAVTTVSFVISVVPANHPSKLYPVFEGSDGIFVPIFSLSLTVIFAYSLPSALNITV